MNTKFAGMKRLNHDNSRMGNKASLINSILVDWVSNQYMPSSGTKKETKGSHGPPEGGNSN